MSCPLDLLFEEFIRSVITPGPAGLDPQVAYLASSVERSHQPAHGVRLMGGGEVCGADSSAAVKIWSARPPSPDVAGLYRL